MGSKPLLLADQAECFGKVWGTFFNGTVVYKLTSKPDRETGLAQVAEYKIVLEKYFLIFPLNNFLLDCYSNYFLANTECWVTLILRTTQRAKL